MLGAQIISDVNTYKPLIDKSKCINCGACVRNCWRGIYAKTEEGIQVDQGRLKSCIGCMECFKLCPTGALSIIEEVYMERPSEIHDFYTLCEVRQSCRDYLDKPVSREQLVQLAEVVRLAPTIRNAQQYKMIIIDDYALRKTFADKVICHENATANSFAKIDLPYFVLFVREKIKEGAINTAKDGFEINYDMGCLGSYFTLAATEMGLSTCIIGRFDNEAAEKMFHIEKGGAAFVVAVGYARSNTIRKKYRKEFKDVISFNKY